MPYRIDIDIDSCTASGSCARALPRVFDVEGDTAVVVDEDGAPDEEVRDAAALCPWDAIILFDRETGACVYP